MPRILYGSITVIAAAQTPRFSTSVPMFCPVTNRTEGDQVLDLFNPAALASQVMSLQVRGRSALGAIAATVGKGHMPDGFPLRRAQIAGVGHPRSALILGPC